MKLDDLIAALQRMKKLQGNPSVMVLDAGTPRDLNLGPILRTISAEDADLTADCEDRVGERCVMIGFGSY